MTKHSTYKGRQIYRTTSGKFAILFRWGDDIGEDLNVFRTLNRLKKFVDEVVVSQHACVSPVKRMEDASL